jgi:hypothetical protein
MNDKRILLVESPIGAAVGIKSIDQPVSVLTEGAVPYFNILPEGVTDESILIKGPVQRADVENKNGRIYPKSILIKEVNRLSEIIRDTGGVLGELDHPDYTTVALQRTPTCIRKLWWEDNTLMAIAEILDPRYNPNAGIAYSIIKAGLPLGISSRGLGSLSYRNGVNIVQEDFEMVCWDLVSDPSTHSAYMRKIPVKKISEELKSPKDKTKNKIKENENIIDQVVKNILWG